MPVLKFRVSWEDEESIFRDILIRSAQTFLEFHEAILNAFEFLPEQNATFFRSNDRWQRGREIILQPDDQSRKVSPLLMATTLMEDAVRNPNEKFIYLYDFVKRWTFLIELIAVTREGNNQNYPICIRKEGPPPKQYGKKKPDGDQMIETEDKYDLEDQEGDAGFSEEGEHLDSEEDENF
ncbi:MAG: hypothetical protein EPN39_03875 [Chitinophagaceae bacterium]|nr:MAG: hypothetical protein EPN39_03875 [Chitinophagaceae bacterium]